jgi:translocation and assembly module TamB
VAATTALFFPLQIRLDRMMERWQEATITELENRFGYAISYARIRPTVLVNLEISDVVIGNQNDPLLKLQRLSVRYHLLQLLRGDIENAVREIVVINTEITIDQEKERALLELIGLEDSGFPAKGPESFSLPVLPDIIISGKNISLVYKGSDYTLSANRIFLSINGGSGPEIEGRGDIDLRFYSDADQTIRENLEAHLSLSGGWDENSAARMIVGLKNVTSSFISLPEIKIQADYDNEGIELKKVADRMPFDLSFAWNFNRQAVELELLMDNFSPASFMSLSGALTEHNPWLQNYFSGSALFHYHSESGDLSYSGDITAEISKTPGVELPFPGPYQVQIQASGDPETVIIDRLRVTSSQMDMNFSGSALLDPLVAEANLEIEGIQLLDGSIHGNAEISYDGTLFRFQSSQLGYNDIYLAELEAILIPGQDKSIEFSLETLFPEEEEEEQGTIFAEGVLEYGDNFYLESSLLINALPLNRIYSELERRNLSVPDFLGEPKLDGSLSFSTDGVRASYALGYLVMREDNQEHYLRFSGTGTLEEHDIRRFDARWGDYSANGSGTVTLQKDTILISSDIQVNDIDYGFNAYFHPGKSLVITGQHGSRAIVRFNNKGIYLAAEAEAFPIPLGKESEVKISFDLYGSYSSSSDWQLNFDSFSLEGPSFIRPDSVFLAEGKGVIDENQIMLSRIDYREGEDLPLKGSLNANYLLSNENSASGWFFMEDPEGREKYIASFDLNSQRFAAELAVTSFPLSKLGLTDLQGRLSGTLEASGSWINPDFRVEMELSEGQRDDQPLELELTAEKQGPLIRLEYGRGRLGNHLLQKLSAGFVMDKGELQLSGEYRPVFEGMLRTVGFDFRGNTVEIDSLKELPSLISAPFDLIALFDPIVTADGEQNPQTYMVIREKESFTVSGGPENAISGYYSSEGSFLVESGGTLPLRGKVEGVLRENEIAAQISIDYADLSLLKPYADITFFSLLDGTASGNLAIEGSLRDPSFNGSVSVTRAVVRSSILPENPEPFDALIRIRDKSISVIAEPIQSGDAFIDASVNLEIERWLPGSFRVDLLTEEDEELRIKYAIPGGGVDVDGYARGSFSIEGTSTTLRLVGDLLASNASVTLQGEATRRDRQASPHRRNLDVFVDIVVNTGRRVEFFWPTVSFPVLRGFAQTGQRLSIFYDSADQRFALQGRVGIQGGEISYLQRNFLISRGVIEFNETAERFDPRLTVEAVLREMDEQGEPIRIYLSVNNQPLSRFEPRFSSDPSMSDAEIIAVLGAALPSRIGQEALDITAGLALTGSLVTQLGIIGSFEARVKDVLNVDLFSIRTQMIQNLIVDRVGSAFTEEAFTGSDFTRYLDNTTVFLGKYFGNDLFIQGTLQIKANQFTEPLVRENELFFDSEISLEWKTPLFLLEIGVQPDFLDPAESMNNASLGLSWSFSY